jgi:hypothetical protein
MPTTFRLDPEGNDALLHQLARGFAEFGEEAAGAISQLAPRNRGGYARSIQATTFIDGVVYSGQPVRGANIRTKSQIVVIIFTADHRGHLFELGTQARTVVAKSGGLMVWPADKYGPGGIARVVEQPGMARRPHFWPGYIGVASRAGEIIGSNARSSRGRVNAAVLP